MTSTESARTRALADAVTEIERHAAAAGWDSPVAVYSLVRTADLVAANPQLAHDLPDGAAAEAEHLTSIEQEGLPEADELEDLLAQLAWPDAVDGAALVVERLVLPPQAEERMPAEAQAATEYSRTHPDREDVRIAVGVLRSGESWCALRSRSHDSHDAVGGGPNPVPGLVQALAATFD